MNSRPFEELVEQFEDSARSSWQKPNVVLEKLGSLNGKKVVDIGAGTGYFSFQMAELGADVAAHDIDQRFLDYIQKKQGGTKPIHTKKVPEDDPLISEESTDIVLVVNTYHHIADRSAYFKKVYYGLKPGGKLFIVDFKAQHTAHGPDEALRVDGLTVLKELQSAGFTRSIIDVNTLPEQYIVSAKK